MDAIKATVKDGRLDMLVPPDWPDGTEVIVLPVNRDAGLGIREEDWPDSAAAAAEWVTWYDSLEPLIFTPDERANWEAVRRKQKEFEKAAFAGRAENLGRAWE